MRLKKDDFIGWHKSEFQSRLSKVLSNMMRGLRYDSLSTYIYLFENDTNQPTEKLFKTSLKNLIDYKGGQDCYDILFELMESIPTEWDPKIVGYPNTLFTSSEQLLGAPYLHVAMTVKDPNSHLEYLLDPGKWIYYPLLLVPGTSLVAEDGNIYTVTSVNSAGFIIDKNNTIPKSHRILTYEWVPADFDLILNYIGYMRLRERYNCITSVISRHHPLHYFKYLFATNSYEARLPFYEGELSILEIQHKSKKIDELFGGQISEKLISFARIHNELPSSFWL